MGLIEILQKIVLKYPEKTAIIDALNGRSYSYKYLFNDIKSLSFIFHKSGIKPDQKISLYFNNSYYQVVSFFSILYMGAIPVLIDGNSCMEEILKFLASSNSTALIGEIDKIHILQDLSKKKDLSIIVFSNNKDKINNKKITLISHAYIKKNKKIIEKSNNKKKIILFTYRGYGYPLPVLISEKAVINSIKSNNYLTEINSSLCISLILPFSHIFALSCNVLSPLSVGGTIVIIKSVMPGKILSFIEKYKVNFMITVPTLVKVLIHYIKKNNFKLSTLKRGIVGGNKFSKELFNEWLNLTGCVLLHGYGLTETCAVFCNQWNNNKPDSFGKTMKGTLAKITDETGNELPCRQTGKLWIKTYSAMNGYCSRDDLNKIIINNGWIDTGDLAWKDEDDFYYFVKRDKLIAKLGGVTVDIKEVKDIINKHPDVQNTEIFIKKDDLWQEKLVCKIKTDKKLTKMDIYNFCSKYISTTKIPKEIIFFK